MLLFAVTSFNTVTSRPVGLLQIARRSTTSSTSVVTKRYRVRATLDTDTQDVRLDDASPSSIAGYELPPTLAALMARLRDAPNSVARYTELIALGTRLPKASPNTSTSENRVHGCVSVVHIRATEDEDGIVNISGAADSAVTRGLIALLALGCVGLSTDMFLKLQASHLATAAMLPTVGIESRTAALTRILDHAQRQLRGISSYQRRSRTHADTAVLLSGGVDSAVALRLALETGRKVRAYYLRIWLAEDEAHLSHCPWADDVASARAVCEQVGVQFEQVPLQDEYRKRVVQYVMREARAGRTPNPDVMCNSRVKFGAFIEHVGSRYDTVVSGHYAKVRDGRLFTSPDLVKDQTYFLAALNGDQLRRAEFPLGEMRKEEVRELARRWRLPNCERADSQGVCFLGKVRWDQFLGLHLGTQLGKLVEWESGSVVGEHEGFWFYTLGQRRGIRLSNGPWYVVSKDIDQNIVYVSKQYWGDQFGMDRRCFLVDTTNWIAGEWPVGIGNEIGLRVKVRHGPTFHGATLRRVGEDKAQVHLFKRDKALAPGQFAVFYRDDECIGCGAIANTFQRPTTAESFDGSVVL